MKTIYVPEEVNYESGAMLGKHSFGMKQIFILFGAFFISLILGIMVYPVLRYPFYAYFIGLVYFGLAPNRDLYLKKNWQAYTQIVFKDSHIYH